MGNIVLNSPWILPPEPEILAGFIRETGVRRNLSRGDGISIEGPDAEVALVESGLAVVEVIGELRNRHIIALVPPGATMGSMNIDGDLKLSYGVRMHSEGDVLVVPRKTLLQHAETDPIFLKCFALQLLRKEHAAMEGMFANFALPLEGRLKHFFRSFIGAYYPLRQNAWNPLPVTIPMASVSYIVNGNRSSISQIISRWAAEGLMKKDGHRLLFKSELLAEPPVAC